MRKNILSLAVLYLFLTPLGAQADLLFNLTPAVQSGSPGDTLTYTGTLQNTGAADVFVNADNFALSGADLALDDTKLLNLTSLLVPAGGPATSFALFDVTVGSTASLGDYFGSFTLLGGADSAGQDILASQNFQVTVTPEPAVIPLLSGMAVFSMSLLGRRHRWQARRRKSCRQIPAVLLNSR